ncbi:D-isomer specific 2-hydroxyacid dehydrogenase family protein [Patulibacter defluvii]|uniref:D-isomer specific 2-hydroxyacid dehydrogenase family protein n=1 Tax=Patulibacter defluvii TaxID=3095358 RepID=UPI002A759287|nr:D-isomer specific 2-hydroxyacid dehydrogenase family protein [Patulibacter sp. DM4]
MIRSDPARTAARPRPPAPWAAPATAATRITVYGCEQDEAALFRALAPGFDVDATITAAPVSVANVALAAGNRCVSVGHKAEVTAATLRALADVGVTYLSTRSVGCDHIDAECARDVGISVGTVAYSPDSVADYTLMLMLMAVRHAKAIVRRADVHDYRLHDQRGRELRDLTVGVIGTGRIGSAVIDRLRGFGCRVLAHDRRPGAAVDHVPLDELLRRSDVVTLHTPLTTETHHLLDQARIARMKPGAVVVNTGRGALVDSAALVAALESGRLGGAALDVVEGEQGIFYADRRDRPIEPGPLRRLQELPNVLVSPHTAYYTDHALRDMVEHTIANCLAFAGVIEHA